MGKEVKAMKKARIGAAVLSLLMLFGCQRAGVSSKTSSEEASSLPNSTETSSPEAVSSSSSASSSVPVARHSLLAFKDYSQCGATLVNGKVGDEFEEDSYVEMVVTFEKKPTYVEAHVNGRSYGISAYGSEAYSFTFVMPAQDIRIVLSAIDETSTAGSVYSIVYTDDHTRVWGIEDGEQYERPVFFVSHDDGYEPFVSAYQTGTKTGVDISFSMSEESYTVEAYDLSHALLTVPITIVVSSADVGLKNITYSGTDHVAASTSVLPKKGTPGDIIRVKMNVTDGYYYENTAFSEATISTTAEPSFIFMMPDKDVALTTLISAYGKVVIPPTEHLTSYDLFSDENLTQTTLGYRHGKDLYIRCKTEEKYQIGALTDPTGKVTFSLVSANVFKASISSDLSGDLSLTPKVVAYHTVTFTANSHVTFTLEDPSAALIPAGKAVYFYAVPTYDYVILSITEQNNAVTISPEAYPVESDKYGFISADQDMVITVTGTTVPQDAKLNITMILNTSTSDTATVTCYVTGKSTTYKLTVPDGINVEVPCKTQDTLNFEVTLSNATANYYINGRFTTDKETFTRSSGSDGGCTWSYQMTHVAAELHIDVYES
jgi:hypothetical protein